MNDKITIQHGVPEDQHHQAALLYCQALSAKLQPFLGSPERAARLLSRGVRSDRAFVALRDNAVVGIAGFQVGGAGLFDSSLRQMWREYRWSALPRALGLMLLTRGEEPDTLLMDGIAVDAGVRSRGIGSRLLDAICRHAAQLNLRYVRLDVIDTNPRAQQLYERQGFVAGKSSGVGPFRLLFPFRSTTAMRKTVGHKPVVQH